MREIPGITITTFTSFDDNRGSLWKLMQADLNKDFLFGETYLTSTKPNHWRGGHFHKNFREWFIVLQGKALFRFYNLRTKDALEIEISCKDNLRIEVAPWVGHSFRNQGKEILVVLAIADKCFDTEFTDTYPEEKTKFGDIGKILT